MRGAGNSPSILKTAEDRRQTNAKSLILCRPEQLMHPRNERYQGLRPRGPSALKSVDGEGGMEACGGQGLPVGGCSFWRA